MSDTFFHARYDTAHDGGSPAQMPRVNPDVAGVTMEKADEIAKAVQDGDLALTEVATEVAAAQDENGTTIAPTEAERREAVAKRELDEAKAATAAQAKAADADKDSKPVAKKAAAPATKK